MRLVPAEQTSLKIALGRAPAGIFAPGLPVLAGAPTDELFGDAMPAGHCGAAALFEAGEWLLGVINDAEPAELETATHRLYGELFTATSGRHLARIWNFVPALNEPGPTGLENYRAFCSGRSRAFEQMHGPGFGRIVPAASAVGCESRALTIVFAASRLRPRHVENPLQLPACEYPPEYGPRAPSFARATIAGRGAGRTVFISGTAAIRGHATVADGIAAQLDCTLGNLREISKACGLGPDLARSTAVARHFRIFLRHASDLPLVAAALGERLLGPADRVAYVRADICRQALLVEIEATLLGVGAQIRTR